MIDRRNFATSEDLAAALADAVAGDLEAAMEARGHALLAVSGGSTPKRFFHALSERPIAWDRVYCTLVDERWVPEDDARSNAALVRNNLLRGKASAARFVPLYTGDPTPEDGIPAAEAALERLPLPFDAAVLGMGTDGHTASFFPGGDDLQAALSDHAGPLATMRAPGAGNPRVTLARATLLQARALYLHIEGEEKARVLERAMAPGPVEEMPVRAMLRQDKADLVIYFSP